MLLRNVPGGGSGPDDPSVGSGEGLGPVLGLELGLGEGAALLGLDPLGWPRRSAAASEGGRGSAA